MLEGGCSIVARTTSVSPGWNPCQCQDIFAAPSQLVSTTTSSDQVRTSTLQPQREIQDARFINSRGSSECLPDTITSSSRPASQNRNPTSPPPNSTSNFPPSAPVLARRLLYVALPHSTEEQEKQSAQDRPSDKYVSLAHSHPITSTPTPSLQPHSHSPPLLPIH